MEKLTKRQLLDEFFNAEFIQYLWSSMSPKEITDEQLDDWDGGFIWWRKLHRNLEKENVMKNGMLVFELTSERNDYRNAIYGHWELSRLKLWRGDEYYKHNDFIVIQSKNDFCTIIYRLQ